MVVGSRIVACCVVRPLICALAHVGLIYFVTVGTTELLLSFLSHRYS